MGVYDVPATELIDEVAKDFRQKLEKPAFTEYVKSGSHKERAPLRPDWWYVRTASILYRVFRDGPVGTESLRTYYGGRKARGRRPHRFAKCSGKVVRSCLQALEKDGLIKKEKKGRSVSAKGQSYLYKKANEVRKGFVAGKKELLEKEAAAAKERAEREAKAAKAKAERERAREEAEKAERERAEAALAERRAAMEKQREGAPARGPAEEKKGAEPKEAKKAKEKSEEDKAKAQAKKAEEHSMKVKEKEVKGAGKKPVRAEGEHPLRRRGSHPPGVTAKEKGAKK